MKKTMFVLLCLFLTTLCFADSYSIDDKLGIGISDPKEALEVNGSILGGTMGESNNNIQYFNKWYLFEKDKMEFGWISETATDPIPVHAGFYQEEESGKIFYRYFLGQQSETSRSSGYIMFSPQGLGINTEHISTGCRLAVNGKIYATEIKVQAIGDWPDFVFKPAYNLRSLNDVDNFIKENGHLPEMPSATQVVSDGVNLGEMQAKLLQKVEELTLYMIELKKENDELKSKINQLKK